MERKGRSGSGRSKTEKKNPSFRRTSRPATDIQQNPKCTCGRDVKPNKHCSCCQQDICSRCAKNKCKLKGKPFSGCGGSTCGPCWVASVKRCHRCVQTEKVRQAPFQQCCQKWDQLSKQLLDLHWNQERLRGQPHAQLLANLLDACKMDSERNRFEEYQRNIQMDSDLVLLRDIKSVDGIGQMSKTALMNILRIEDDLLMANSSTSPSNRNLVADVTKLWHDQNGGKCVRELSREDMVNMDEQQLKMAAIRSVCACATRKELVELIVRMRGQQQQQRILLQDIQDESHIGKMSAQTLKDILRIYDAPLAKQSDQQRSSTPIDLAAQVVHLWRNFRTVQCAEDLTEAEVDGLDEQQLRLALFKSAAKRRKRPDQLRQVKRLRASKKVSQTSSPAPVLLLRDIASVEDVYRLTQANLTAILREFETSDDRKLASEDTGSLTDRVINLWNLYRDAPPVDQLEHDSIDQCDEPRLKVILRKCLDSCVDKQNLIGHVKKLKAEEEKQEPGEPDDTSKAPPPPPLGIASPDELTTLSVREIRALLNKHSIDSSSYYEKPELVAKLTELWHDIAKHSGEVPEADRCLICMDARIDCVFLECGHMATCNECGRQVKDCPVCRMYVTRVVRTYRP